MKLAARPPRLAAPLLAAALLAAGGCAHVEARNPADPWEPWNRSVSQLNDGVDAVLLKPSATFYREKVPPLIRTGVSNFFGNLGDAWSFVNSALQGKLQHAGENLARVQINTLFGVLGIFDVASDLNIERHREDFGQTLGHWGVPAGPYIVLPFFGPSTLRDTLALPVDRQGDLVRRIDPTGLRTSAYGVRILHQRASLLRAGDVLDQAALDRYSFVRDAYLQRRRAEIYEPGDPRRDEPPLVEEPSVIPVPVPAPTPTPSTR